MHRFQRRITEDDQFRERSHKPRQMYVDYVRRDAGLGKERGTQFDPGGVTPKLRQSRLQNVLWRVTLALMGFGWSIPLPTSRVVYEMAVVLTRQERHFELAVCGVLGANKEPKAESADRESPRRGVITAPMADEPRENESHQPDAANPHKVVPHRRVSIYGGTSSQKEMSPMSGPDRRAQSAQTPVVPWSGARDQVSVHA
jgi:hypothetical protein